MSAFSYASVRRLLPSVLEQMPPSWRGTTYDNSRLLGRESFAVGFRALVERKAATGSVTRAELEALGEAEDYFRVSNNVTTLLEMVLALRRLNDTTDVAKVFTFASTRMPLVALALVAKRPVHVYHASAPAPFNAAQAAALSLLSCHVVCHAAQVPADAAAHRDEVVVEYVAHARDGLLSKATRADAVAEGNVLYILRADKIDPAEVMIRRKRMSTPVTTPVAEAQLRALAGLRGQPPMEPESSESVAALLGHLQTLNGTPVDPSSAPVVFSAGLPSLAALWLALIARGGFDVLMASTAYGGSSQVTDLLQACSPLLRKHTFDVQGAISMEASVQSRLTALAASAKTLMPTTLLFIETPTNPDMKVPDLAKVAAMLEAYQRVTHVKVLVLVDNTFAPNAQLLAKFRAIAPRLNVVVFTSLSKAVSRGMTTGGCMVFSQLEEARALRAQVLETTELLDVGAKPDQLRFLCDNHVGTEERCDKAYRVAVAAGEALVKAVRTFTGRDMALAFVSPATAAQGITTPTFSFNLPPLPNAKPGDNEALAQRFVDALVEKNAKLFKPCVSFGQDNGLVYCTVPATSTQGAIKAEDKAKQAQGGVQLTRLSFPPTIDEPTVHRVLTDAVAKLYAAPTLHKL